MIDTDIKYWEEVLGMTTTEGFKLFKERAEDVVGSLTEQLISGTSSETDDIIRGRILVYREIIALEDSVQFLMEQAKMEEDEDASV